MEFSELLSFLGILSETLKIISMNRKIIAIIAAISILILSSLFVVSTFSTRQVIKNLFGQQTLNLLASMGTPAFPALLVETKNDIIFILAVEWVIILASAAVHLLSVGSTILVSVAGYYGNNLCFQDLVPTLAKSLVKQLVTSFHTTIFAIGFMFCFWVMQFLPLLLIFDHPTQSKIFCYAMLGVALIFIAYLSIVWSLAMVITVVEKNCFGMEALGKAARLIKGKKIQGFAINSILVLGTLISQFLTTNRDQTSVSMRLVIGVFFICFNFMVLVLLYVSYTVLYFRCKKSHGEEIELQEDWGYSKLALITEDLP